MTNYSSRQLGFSARYLLDANIFIAAWRDYYPIDVHRGFWECLHHFEQEQRLLSIDRVRDEINGPPDLVNWLRQNWRGAFASTNSNEVATVFSEMQNWVQSSPLFLPAAKHEFAQVADGWLAAFAKANSTILVTNEVYNDQTRRKVPLPNLCREFDVEYCNTVEMLRGLGVTFDLRTPS